MDIIEIRNLRKYYGKSRGIEDVSVSIPKGVIFGFIGPNGAGKSTTIRILLSLIRPTSGEARIFGLDCRDEGQKIRMNVGYIPAEVNFYDDMKVSDFLEYSARLYRKDCRRRSAELCGQLDMETGKRIAALSSGNKKKLAIIQALQHEPDVLILDEPTAGLDPLMQNRLYEMLRAENSRGVTIFFSSHVLSEVQKMCDRVAIIKEGRILRTESVDSLRRSQYKMIRIEFRHLEDAAHFVMPGAEILERREHQVSCIFSGDIDLASKSIAAFEIVNLWMDEPSLEDIFLHFYEKEGK